MGDRERFNGWARPAEVEENLRRERERKVERVRRSGRRARPVVDVVAEHRARELRIGLGRATS